MNLTPSCTCPAPAPHGLRPCAGAQAPPAPRPQISHESDPRKNLTNTTLPLSSVTSNSSANHHLYADDTQLFLSFSASVFCSTFTCTLISLSISLVSFFTSSFYGVCLPACLTFNQCHYCIDVWPFVSFISLEIRYFTQTANFYNE